MRNRTCGEGWERGQKAILEYLKGKGAGRLYVVGGQLVYRDQENRQTCSRKRALPAFCCSHREPGVAGIWSETRGDGR